MLGDRAVNFEAGSRADFRLEASIEISGCNLVGQSMSELQNGSLSLHPP